MATAATKFILPNKKVTIKPLVKSNTFMGVNGHDGAFMYTGTSKAWVIFRKTSGEYINPLTKAEQIFFEKEMDEDFNVNHKDHFWKEFQFKITKTTTDINFLKKELNLSKPLDYLAYKLLLTAPDVANNWKSRNFTPEYEWVMIEADEDAQSTVTMGKRKALCYKWIDDNSSKPNILRDVLWLMRVNVSTDNTKNELLGNLYNIVEIESQLKELHSIITADDLNLRILFIKLVKGRFINTKDNKYYDREGNLIAHNKVAIMTWLNNPENSSIVEAWKDEVSKLKF